MNQLYVPRYSEKLFDPDTLTRFQVSVILGIELFFGNYREYLAYILAKEFEFFKKLFEIQGKFQELANEQEMAVIEGRLHEVDDIRKKYAKYNEELKKMKNDVPKYVKLAADKLGIPEKEITELVIKIVGGSIQE